MYGKAMLRIIAITACLQVANAEDALVQGGKSIGGKYGVYVYRDQSEISGEFDGYSYKLFDFSNGTVLKRFQVGGAFCDYNGAVMSSKVMWSPSGRFFALTDHGGRHDVELYIYRVEQSTVTALKVPNYLQRALRLIGADEVFRSSVVEPVEWDGDSLISNFYFDAEKDSTPSGPYTTRFTLAMPKAENAEVELSGMDKPIPNSND